MSKDGWILIVLAFGVVGWLVGISVMLDVIADWIERKR